MKTNHLIIISALSLLQIFSSCKKETIQPNTKSTPTSESVQAIAEDKTYMNTLVYKTVLITFGASVGDINAFKTENSDNLLASCAVITTDTSVFPYRATIDFNNGCTLNDGTPVSGVIHATYTHGNLGVVGSTAVLDMDSFYINSNHLIGNFTLHNKGNNANSNLEFDVTISGGNLIFGSDGRIVKQDVSWLVEWQANGTLVKDDDFFSFSGTASGVTSNGDNFTESITSPLLMSRDQNCVREFISGVTVAQIDNNPDLTIDYGTSTCDTKADATQGGVTVRIDLQDY